jgi:hypothetical protein
VTGIDFQPASVKGFDFSLLSKLPRLERLTLWGADINNQTLDSLAGLKLRDLRLSSSDHRRRPGQTGRDPHACR